MLKNLTIGTKISSGFFILFILLFTVAYIGYSGLSGIVENIDKVDNMSRITKTFLNTRDQEKNFIITSDFKFAEGVEKGVLELNNQIEAAKKTIEEQFFLKQMDDLLALLSQYQKAFNAYEKTYEKLIKLDPSSEEAKKTKIELGELANPMFEVANKAQDICDKASMFQKDVMLKQIKKSNTAMLLGALISFLIAIFLSFFITLGITRPIRSVIEGLTKGSDLVAMAAYQVATSSQSLAEGAAEQAASIEETSSSLEEMSSMTKQNADNANQANNLMKSANQVVDKANKSMSELTTSMTEIFRASEETSKIIKTIDEIAFQTNLLALNAAVEAARAGEAGAGFAVVADEVRNLARRAAEAAKNTAYLIEGTVKKINDGAELVKKTDNAFSEVSSNVAKVGELVGEISAASFEQSGGIEEVNRAVASMDKITQQNATSAEESATASQEMKSQANSLKILVDKLINLVGSKIIKCQISDQELKIDALEEDDDDDISSVRSLKKHKALISSNKIPAPKEKKKGIRPEKVIPFDEDDDNFENF